MGAVVEKVKGPAVAGGAALVGLAGGVALTQRRRKRGPLSRMPKPKLKKPSLSLPKMSAPDIKMPKPKDLAKSVGHAAEEVGKRSQQVGQVASDVQRATSAIEGSKGR